MRWRVVPALVLMMGLVPMATSAQVVAGQPVVLVGLSTLMDDRPIASGNYSVARDPGAVLMGTAFWGACSAGVAAEPPAQAVYAWRVDGRLVSMAPNEATVEFTWQRVLGDVAASPSPGGPVRRTLRLGESATLDSVDGMKNCSGAAVSLSYVVRFVQFPATGSQTITGYVPVNGRRAPNVSVRLRQDPRDGAGAEAYTRTNEMGQFRFELIAPGRYVVDRVTGPRGADVVVGSPAAQGETVATIEPSTAFDEKTFLLETVAQLQALAEQQRYNVDLWLVHSVPNREDHVIHQTVRPGTIAAPFQFSPIKVATPQGEVTVTIEGSVATIATPRGSEFVFVADRRVLFLPAGAGGRSQTTAHRGGTRITHAIPELDEVLSFQMPGIRIPGGPSVPDRFSIRLRMTPRAR